MKPIQKLTAMILSVVLLAGMLCTGAWAADSESLAGSSPIVSSWAEANVAQADDLGLIPSGLPADYTQPITRGQFCKLAVELYETVMDTTITGRATFTDTSDVNVQKMAYLKVINGYGDGTFGPNDLLTREQAAVILARLMDAMGITLSAEKTPFTDAVSSWAVTGVAQVYGAEIMIGTTATTFSPYQNYTIEQSIVTMLREYHYADNRNPAAEPEQPEEETVKGGACGTNVKWTLDSTGVLTISGTGKMSYYSHTKQPWYSLRGQVRSIVVEEGVTEMFHSAFRDCYNATSVSLPSSISRIDGYLFNGCSSLTSITIPKTVSSVDYYYAFGGCTALQSINVEQGNPSYCSVDGVLFTKDKTGLCCYPDGKTGTSYTIPSGVQSVYNFGANDYITSLTVPSSVTWLMYNSIKNCDNLTDLHFATTQAFYSAIRVMDITNTEWERYTIHTGTSVEEPSTDPTTPETPSTDPGTGDAVLANGKEITDDNIREILYGLQDEYPEGMHWTNANKYYSSAMHITGLGCAGFAFICSDAVFGDLPITSKHSDFDAIRVGDILRINNNTHSVVVLEKRADSVIVTEGNYNSSIHWGREISRSTLENGNFYAQSRYPV